jgi:Right handed beta helix region
MSLSMVQIEGYVGQKLVAPVTATLVGTIRNRGQTIPSGTVYSALTDAHGYYTLTVPSNGDRDTYPPGTYYQVACQAAGYSEQVSVPSPDGTGTVLAGITGPAGPPGPGAAGLTLAVETVLVRRAARYYADQPNKFDRYLDASQGNDSNDGLTPQTAWATLGKVNALGSTTGQNLRIGLKRGEVWRLTSKFAVPATGMLFGAYGSPILARPKIKGSTDLTGNTWTSVSGSIYSTPVSPGTAQVVAYWQEDTPLAIAANQAAMAVGTCWTDTTAHVLYVWLPDSSNPTGQQLEIPLSAADQTFDMEKGSCVLQDICIKHGYTYAVIWMPNPATGDGGAIKRCEIGPAQADGILAVTTGGLIEDCYIHHCWNGYVYGSGGNGHGIHANPCNGLTIRFNTFYANDTHIVLQGTQSDNSVHHNFCRLANTNGIDMQGGISGRPSYAYNNVIHHRPRDGVGHGLVQQSLNAGAGQLWRNNIAVSDFTGTPTNAQLFCVQPSATAGVDVDYNLGWLYPGSTCNYGRLDSADHATFASWIAALAGVSQIASKEAHGVNADPLFTSLATGDFTLLPDSPGRDAGVSLIGWPPQITVGTAPDLGP